MTPQAAANGRSRPSPPASGTQLIQELITDGCHGVTRYQPTGDKTMRLHAQTAVIENGLSTFPRPRRGVKDHQTAEAISGPSKFRPPVV